MNLNSEQTVQSDANGEFTINAKVDEMVVFPSEKYEYKRYIIKEDDLRKNAIVIELVEKPIQLEEVIVNKNINPEDLGLVPKGQKKYTVAERRLKQAGEFKPMAMIGMVAGLSIPVDPIINAITGRTKMLKKDLKTETRERNLAKLRSIYQTNYFTDRLHIEPAYVEGFQYYVVEDANFVSALNSGVKAKVDFGLAGLAQKYNELHAVETH